jgi:hypothetical protein
MTELMTEFAPMAAMAFVALCIVWLVWRGIRNLFRSASPERHEMPRVVTEASRREPHLGASTPPSSAPSTVPDAADVLSLKASIDALARQIGLLEKRLSPANTNTPPVLVPRAASTEPEARKASAEPPVILPEGRI